MGRTPAQRETGGRTFSFGTEGAGERRHPPWAGPEVCGWLPEAERGVLTKSRLRKGAGSLKPLSQKKGFFLIFFVREASGEAAGVPSKGNSFGGRRTKAGRRAGHGSKSDGSDNPKDWWNCSKSTSGEK